MEFLTYRHVVNLGDLISVLPGIKHLYEETGKKAIIYQQLNRPGEYYPGAYHPTQNNGQLVCFNQEMFDMMRPLLLTQEYIENFLVYNGETVDYDLDVVRLQMYCGAPNYPLHKWLWMVYPEMTCDLSERWIELPLIGLDLGALPISNWEDIKKIMDQTGVMFYRPKQKKILINFTERYRNYNINYFFLKEYEKQLQFIGTEKEYDIFKNQWRLNLDYLKVNNFTELVFHLQECDFFLGCQSFCWHLAEAMKIPRLLELSPYVQNCTSFGENGFEFYHQIPLEKLFKQLYNDGSSK